MISGRSIAQTSPETSVSGWVEESSDQLSGAESALLLAAFFTLAVSLMSFVAL